MKAVLIGPDARRGQELLAERAQFGKIVLRT